MHRPNFKTVILPADREYPFTIMANCYPHPRFDIALCRNTPQTLIVLHSTSFHKEALEPMVADVFSLTTSQNNIREVWIIECPNHGESAVRNQDALAKPENVRYFSCERYAEAARRLLLAEVEDGPQIRLRSDKIIGIGHSLGGCAIVFLAKMMPVFATLVLLEPFLLPIPDSDISQLRSRMVTRAEKRTNSWRTKQDVEIYLRRRPWDERVSQMYTAYAIRWPDKTTNDQYSLSCTREQEVTMYRDEDGATKPIKYLDELCEKIPVHVAFGEKADVVPKHAQEALVKTESRRFASIKHIAGAGHLVPQENPQGAARFIAGILRCTAARL